MSRMSADTMKTSYFLAKVHSIPALTQCIDTGRWACKDKLAPPHPRDVLTEAFCRGPVVIIFSVNNCHGYHGYAEMVSAPGCIDGTESLVAKPGEHRHNTHMQHIKDDGEIPNFRVEEGKYLDVEYSQNDEKSKDTKSSIVKQVEQNKGITDSMLGNANEPIDTANPDNWHFFHVKWKVAFLKGFGEQCLPFSHTSDIFIDVESDVKLPLNKCRNWQELPHTIGQNVCELLESHFSSLCAKRDERLQKQLDNQEKAFYETDREERPEQTWRKIISQVEGDLGRVILACPFGSQRYNVSTPESDTDMFLVYQARTSQVLGFNPPKQTIKSSEREMCDYTIHEVYRYCELLASGDARCVETLFLHDSSVISSTDQWQKLKEGRRMLLNKECLNKYLRDAQGSKGSRYLRKWCDDHKQVDILPAKLCKMLYVIVRLLQNARDVVRGEDLRVYRETGSADRDVLMAIRAGNVPVATAWQLIHRLESEISQKEVSVPEKSEKVPQLLERWLLELRYRDMQDSSTTLIDSHP